MLNKIPDSIMSSPEVISPVKAETAETKEEITLKIQNELNHQGKLEGIKFSFPEPRFKVVSEKLYPGLNWDYFSSEIDEQEKEELSLCFNRLVQYLDSPIIVDNFSDHSARRDWEHNNLEKISPEAKAYYEHNRLGLNFASSLNKMINILNLEFENKNFISRDIIDRLNIFFSMLPVELQDGHSEDYAKLNTEEKIAICDKLVPLITATLRTIGVAKLEQAN